MTMNELQDVIDEGNCLEHRGLTRTESTQYGLVDLPCHPSARFSSCGHPSIMECAGDIRKCLYANVVLSDSVAMIQEISKQIPNECDVSDTERTFFLVTVGSRSPAWAQS